MSANPDEDLVTLQVPRRLYAQMVLALAGAMTTDRGADDGDPAPEGAGADPASGPPRCEDSLWRPEEIAELKRSVTNPTIRALLNLAAERRGDFVYLKEIEDRVQRSADEIRADLAGFTRQCRQFHRAHEGSVGPDIWPFARAWQDSLGSATRYTMDPSVAQWWREAAISPKQALRTRVDEFIQTEPSMAFDFSDIWYASWTLPEWPKPPKEVRMRWEVKYWTPSKRPLLFSFQFGPDPNGIQSRLLGTYSLMVGPAPEPTRSKLLDLAGDPKVFPRPFDVVRFRNLAWTLVCVKRCLDPEAIKAADADEIARAFADSWAAFRDGGELDAIRSAFRPIADPTWWAS